MPQRGRVEHAVRRAVELRLDVDRRRDRRVRARDVLAHLPRRRAAAGCDGGRSAGRRRARRRRSRGPAPGCARTCSPTRKNVARTPSRAQDLEHRGRALRDVGRRRTSARSRCPLAVRSSTPSGAAQRRPRAREAGQQVARRARRRRARPTIGAAGSAMIVSGHGRSRAGNRGGGRGVDPLQPRDRPAGDGRPRGAARGAPAPGADPRACCSARAGCSAPACRSSAGRCSSSP